MKKKLIKKSSLKKQEKHDDGIIKQPFHFLQSNRSQTVSSLSLGTTILHSTAESLGAIRAPTLN